tara:strand:- start:532 stop:897 length:366 start_codon:yes stop_codon:yes gene_type:complete
MKVFQDIRTAIQEWEDSRSLILSIANKLNCSESEIMGKIEQLQNARPANDLNAINDRLDNLMDSLGDALSRAEDVESSVDTAYREIEYVDANDAVAAIQDIEGEFDDFRKSIKRELNGETE